MEIYELKIDLVALSRTYAGKWVAMDPETYEVVVVGSSAQEVLDGASAAGIDEPLITSVVADYSAFAPCSSR